MRHAGTKIQPVRSRAAMPAHDCPPARLNHSGALYFLKMSALAIALSGISACSVSKNVTASDDNALVTASITKPIEAEGIDSSDAELIKEVVAKSETGTPPPMTLAWSNPDTGNKGTITAIDKFVGSHGQQCKKFQTSVDTFMGVSIYNGETCELRKDMWVLSWFLRD